MTDRRPTGFNIFAADDNVIINRRGKEVIVKGKDNTFVESSTVESNLLLEILKQLKKGA